MLSSQYWYSASVSCSIVKYGDLILTTIGESPSNALTYIYPGQVISGVGIGGILAVAPAYLSVRPLKVRGRIGCS